jgi:hypothetical protein
MKKFKNLFDTFMAHAGHNREHGNSSIATIMVIGGVAVMGVQHMYTNTANDINRTKMDLARNSAMKNNVVAIKTLENLTQPSSTTNYNSSNPASFPLIYPKPYTGATNGAQFSPTSQASGSNWSLKDGQLAIAVPDMAKLSPSSLAQLFAHNSKVNPQTQDVALVGLRPQFSADPYTSPFVIEGYELVATSRTGANVQKTAALIKLPPPPAPTCELILDNPKAVYRPSALVKGKMWVNGVALKVRVPGGNGGYREVVTIENQQSIDERYAAASFTVAAPRPIAVVDGAATMQVTISAEVVGLNNEVGSCSTTYTLAMPPYCGIIVQKYVLAPEECVDLDIFKSQTDASFSYTENEKHVKGNKFCMPKDPEDGEQFKLEGRVSSLNGESECQATFVADTTKANKCPFLAGKSADVTFMIITPQGSSAAQFKFELGKDSFEIPVISRSQEDSRVCPKNSRCFAMLGKQARNLFLEVRNADSDKCSLVGIDRVNLGCFAEETRIAVSKNETRLIRELQVGDLVWNPVKKVQVRIARMTAGPETLPLIVVHTAGRSLKVTTEHPMVTDRGLIMAELLEAGDAMVMADGSLEKVVRVESVLHDGAGSVRNFIINPESTDPDDHMVLAEGIVTGDLYLQSQLKKDLEQRHLSVSH